MRAPNKEVSAAVMPPLLGRPEPKRRHAAEALAIEARDSLVSGDMERFQKSFGLFLAQFPFSAQEANELYCRKLFHMATAMANFGAATQTGEPRAVLDSLIREKSGGDWAVGLKVQSEEKNSKGECPRRPESPSEEAELRDTMAPLVREAPAQIKQKHAELFDKSGGSLLQVPVAAARGAFVLAQRAEVKRGPLQQSAPDRRKGSPQTG